MTILIKYLFVIEKRDRHRNNGNNGVMEYWIRIVTSWRLEVRKSCGAAVHWVTRVA
jgi:hypothetical protein